MVRSDNPENAVRVRVLMMRKVHALNLMHLSVDVVIPSVVLLCVQIYLTAVFLISTRTKTGTF